MKTSTAILTLSLAANAALLAVLSGFGQAHYIRSPALVDARRAADEPVTAGKNNATTAQSASAWARLRTDDLAVLVARLRAAGFPPAMVLGMIRALVKERFDTRRLELSKADFAIPFWKRRSRTADDAKLGTAWRKLALEEDAFMHGLIGPGYVDLLYATDDVGTWRRRHSGNLAPEKLDQFYSVRMDYEERASELSSAATVRGNYAPLQSDHLKQIELEQAYRAELGQFLSPAEVSEIMIRNGSVSRDVGYLFTPMRLTEEQYRAIYPLYQAFQDQNPTVELLSYKPADASPAARAALEQLNTQVAAMLGPDRAADIEQVFNSDNHNLNFFVSQLDLPVSAAANVGAVWQDIQQRVSAVNADNSLSAEARRIQLAALAQEAAAKVAVALGGQHGLDAYKSNYLGRWLGKLAPPKG